jgi:tetratricopeptide (TPR) repeat protein
MPPSTAAHPALLGSPAALDKLRSELSAGTSAKRLSLASAVARAAHASATTDPRVFPAWRLAVSALRKLRPALASFPKNGADRDSTAGIEVYAALYALAVSEAPGKHASDEQRADAMAIASQALRAVLTPAVASKPVVQQSSARSSAPEADVADDFSFLDQLLFSGAGSLGWTQLLPAASTNSPTVAGVVAAALVARLNDTSLTLSDRFCAARALALPWTKCLSAQSNAPAYRRKIRAALLRAASAPPESRQNESTYAEMVLRVRVFAASIDFDAEDYARVVLRAANSFLRSGGRRSSASSGRKAYMSVASVYDDAVAFFVNNVTSAFSSERLNSEDVCSWLDHVFVVYGATGEEQARRSAVALTERRRAALANTWLSIPATLQCVIASAGLHSRDPGQWNAVEATVNNVLECLADYGDGVDKNHVDDGSLELRILRVLEPVRNTVCSDKEHRHDALTADILASYVTILLNGCEAVVCNSFVQTRLKAMTGAALAACESLIRVYSAAMQPGPVHVAINQCQRLLNVQSLDPADTASSSSLSSGSRAQWATWLAAMLNNAGVDLYNRHAKKSKPDDKTMLQTAAQLMEASSNWLATSAPSISLQCAVDEVASTCQCQNVTSAEISRCVKRLSFAADAYLLSASDDTRQDALRVGLIGLHMCQKSEVEAPFELTASFARAAAEVATHDPESFQVSICKHRGKDISFFETALLATRSYAFYARRKRTVDDLKQLFPPPRANGILVAQHRLAGEIAAMSLSVNCDFVYLRARLDVLLGHADALQAAASVRRYFASSPEQDPRPFAEPSKRHRRVNDKSSSSSTSTSSSLSSSIAPVYNTSDQVFSVLADTWIAVQGLDAPAIVASLAALQNLVARLIHVGSSGGEQCLKHESRSTLSSSDMRWLHVLELCEWAAFVLALNDMDQLSVDAWYMVQIIAPHLSLRTSVFDIADLHRRLGWTERCWKTLRTDETIGIGECKGVHGRILNDLNRFEDAKSVMSGASDARCLGVKADAALLGRGNVHEALKTCKTALKCLLSLLSSSTSRRSKSNSNMSILVVGSSVITRADLNSAHGRSRQSYLIELVECLLRMSRLHARIDCIRDARYYAEKGRDLAKLLAASGLEQAGSFYICALPHVQRFAPASGASFAEEMGGRESADRGQVLDADAHPYQDDGVVNPLLLARMLVAQGDAAFEEGSEPPVSDLLKRVLEKYDSACALLQEQDDCVHETDGEILQLMSAGVLIKRGNVLLRLGDIASAFEAFECAFAQPQLSHETRIAASIGLCEAFLARGDALQSRTTLQAAATLVHSDGSISPRIVKHLWRMLARVELALGPSGDQAVAAKFLAQAHGTSFGIRRLLACGQAQDEIPDVAANAASKHKSCWRGRQLELADMDLLTRTVGAMSLSSVTGTRLGTSSSLALNSDSVAKLQSSLGAKRTLVGLQMSSDKSELILWRIAECDTGVIRLPIPTVGISSFASVNERFANILEEMKQMSVGDRILTTNEKTRWWRKRFELDHNLGELLAEVETVWLGPARGLLLPVALVKSRIDNQSIPPLVAAFGAAMAHLPGVFTQADVAAIAVQLGGGDTLTVSSIVGSLTGISSPSQAKKRQHRAAAATSRGDRQTRRSKKLSLNTDMSALSPCPTMMGELLLSVDSELEHFPWECMPILRLSKCGVMRLPHVSLLTSAIGACEDTPSSVFYLLNPSGDLAATQATFQTKFEGQEGWTGMSGKGSGEADVAANIASLERSDVFVYCGHGGGEIYVPPRRLASANRVPISILMGCSSGRLEQYTGGAESSGTAIDYLLAGAPAVVANLWDVSDRDIDRLTAAFLHRWLGVEFGDGDEVDDGEKGAEGLNHIAKTKRMSIAASLAHARDSCRLPFLVGAATVVYKGAAAKQPAEVR